MDECIWTNSARNLEAKLAKGQSELGSASDWQNENMS